MKKGIICLFLSIALLAVVPVLGHGDIPHETPAEPSFPIWFAMVTAIATGVLPIMFGFLIPYFIVKKGIFRKWFGDNSVIILRGIGTGFLLFLFYDFGSLSSFIGLNSTDIAKRVILPIIFFGGLLLLIRYNDGEKIPYHWIWIFGVGIHSIAEGIIMGSNFLLPEPDVIRFLPGLSFVFHKLVEGYLGGILVSWEDKNENQGFVYGLIAGIPILFGVPAGYYNINFFGGYIVYFYTATMISIVYVLIHMLSSFESKNHLMTIYETTTIGLLIFYLFTILHEI